MGSLFKKIVTRSLPAEKVQDGSIELITRNFPDWLHPRLRFFAGRENKLPVDQPELIACIAPRPCLISTALNDAVEQMFPLCYLYSYSRHRNHYAMVTLPSSHRYSAFSSLPPLAEKAGGCPP